MHQWHEILSDDVPGMLKIVQLLTRFDKRIGRRHYDGTAHLLRDAIAASLPRASRFFLLQMDDFIFRVIAYVEDVSVFATSWVHEDGIAQEKEGQETSHAVYKIECVSDFFMRANTEPSGVPECVKILMEDKVHAETN